MPSKVGENVYHYMVRMGNGQSPSKEGFVITLSHALKGSLEEKSALLVCMACGPQTDAPTLSQVKQVGLENS